MKNSRLDLHGVRHQEVSREIDKFLGEHLLGGTKTVSIVTGNSTKMKEIVGVCLEDYGLEYVQTWYNGGELVINLT